MRNLIYVLLIVTAAGAVVPSAFAEEYRVSNAEGASAPGCETNNECFLPYSLTINVGDTVIWDNPDNAAHFIESGVLAEGGPDGVFSSDIVSPGTEFSHTFDEEGKFPYFCSVHPWMLGEIIVTADGAMMDDMMMVEGEVGIATLYPLTGDLSSIGIQIDAAAELAINDFNDYLEATGESWSFAHTKEDNTTSPVVSFEKIQAINAKNIDIVIGPASSGAVTQVLPYANTNNMLLVGCCSTSPALAIADDNLFRVVSDDRIQSKGVAKLMEANGFEVFVPIWRGDTYGDFLVDGVRNSFEERGFASYEGVRLNPDQAEFSTEIAFLANEVQQAVDAYGQDKVAVFIVEFDNTIPIIQTANDYDILRMVQWYTAEAFVGNPDINDSIVMEFVDQVQLVGYLPDVSRDDYRLKLHLEQETGVKGPSTFVYSSYDAVWLVGLSIIEAQSAEVDAIKSVIHNVAENMKSNGAGALNEAGDLALGNYLVYKTENGQWAPTGERYTGLTDSLD